MATRSTEFTVPVAEFASALLAHTDVGSRAQLTADLVAQMLPDTSVVLYVIDDPSNPAWIPKAIVGKVNVSGSLEFGTGVLGTVATNKSVVVFAGAELQREDYSHLDVRRTVSSLAYVPPPRT